MENDISSWIQFVETVERCLERLDNQLLSKSYIDKIIQLIDDIKTDARLIDELGMIEKQESYIRINKRGNELRTMAYFAEMQSA